ncbi:MAG: helix-turn-helix domain-containing protein [Acidobacteria bacterium]|nr:helix-turn-helix domain-containing protein [Acidobacteriota bacterium]
MKRMANNTNSPAVFTVCEVAKILRIGKISAYQAVARGEVPCLRIGRRILIPRHALESILQQISDTQGRDVSSAA